ncbi:MAG: GerMN domain-containing protein [Candidatus Bipolaricaulia bacterium]
MAGKRVPLLVLAIVGAIAIGGGVSLYLWQRSLREGVPEPGLGLGPGKAPAPLKVQLYYYNETRDKELTGTISCSPEAVLPVEREIPYTKTPIQDTIRLLLEGELTAQERAEGFATEFPHSEFKLLGASLKRGVLTLKFADPTGFTSGGSCRTGLLAAQIIKTAKQFPDVREVRFEPESLFQP